MTIKLASISWYTPEDYPAILKIMSDWNKFPASYTQWRQKAEVGEEKLRREGYTVIRVEINPETFPAWCARHVLNIDAKARSQFTTSIAHEKMRDSK